MTTTALIQMVKDHTQYDLDNYSGTAPTDAQIVAQLNWAQRTIARIIEPYHPLIALTLVTDQLTYNLRDITTPVVAKKVVIADRVMVNGVWLCARDGRETSTWSMDELATYAPSWMTDGNGTPTKAAQYDRTLILHPKPSSTFSNSYISGVYLPADLSSSALSTEPDLPEEIHEALALIAAVYAADPLVSEAEGVGRLSRLNARAMEAIRQAQMDNQNARSSLSGTLDSYFARFLPV